MLHQLAARRTAVLTASLVAQPLVRQPPQRSAAGSSRRATRMLATIVLMAGGSAVIGILPTYAQVGAGSGAARARPHRAGPVARRRGLRRLAYLGEIAPPEWRGRCSSFLCISTGSALLIASLMGFGLSRTLSREDMASYGWRIPSSSPAFSRSSACGCAALTPFATVTRQAAIALLVVPLSTLVRPGLPGFRYVATGAAVCCVTVLSKRETAGTELR